MNVNRGGSLRAASTISRFVLPVSVTSAVVPAAVNCASTAGTVWTGVAITIKSQAASSPAVADGKIVIGCDDGSVYCFGVKTEKR